jgi:ArsR family transcriptional regulator, arsenate/arsenite/antimonite-responsive transcriptional repressor
VCQVIELLGLAPSTVSKHLSILHQAGLVELRKAGRWAYYRLADGKGEGSSPLVRDAIAFATRFGAEEPRAADDCRRLDSILKENPEDVCRRQMKGRSSCCSSAPATPAIRAFVETLPDSLKGR